MWPKNDRRFSGEWFTGAVADNLPEDLRGCLSDPMATTSSLDSLEVSDSDRETRPAAEKFANPDRRTNGTGNAILSLR